MFELDRFKLPDMSDEDRYAQRIKTNLIYYQANYLVFAGVCLLFVCISHPSFLIAMLLAFAGGFYLFVYRTQPVVIGNVPLSRPQLVGVFSAASFVLFLIFGGLSCLVALCICTIFVIAHSSLRQRSLKSRSATFLDGGSTPLGNVIKSVDEASDDEATANGIDEENPPPVSVKDQQIKADAAKFRSTFRAQMRAKYQKTDAKRS